MKLTQTFGSWIYHFVNLLCQRICCMFIENVYISVFIIFLFYLVNDNVAAFFITAQIEKHFFFKFFFRNYPFNHISVLTMIFCFVCSTSNARNILVYSYSNLVFVNLCWWMIFSRQFWFFLFFNNFENWNEHSYHRISVRLTSFKGLKKNCFSIHVCINFALVFTITKLVVLF